MKQAAIIILVISFVSSCSNATRQVNNEQGPVTNLLNENSERHHSAAHQFVPDTVIGHISLLNPDKVEEYLGDNIMDRLTDDDLPNLGLLSSDKKQLLTFYFHPGGNIKEFSEFKVGYIDNADSKLIISSGKEFITESKIKLGISMAQLIESKGEPDSISNNGLTIFHYLIDKFDNPAFLKRYNMPGYYADYQFKNGYLTEFRFGFDYP